MWNGNGESKILMLALWTVLISPAAAAQSMDSVPGTDAGCGALRLMVRDVAGHPIAGASVWVNGSFPAISDSSGWAETRFPDANRGTVSVSVSANGYKSQQAFLLAGDCNREIVLNRAQGHSLPETTTISVDELGTDVKKESMALQQGAAKAGERGDYSSSLQLLFRAFRLTPSDPAISNNIGFCFLRRGDVKRATIWFEKAVNLAPFDPTSSGNLGLVRWIQGDHETSRLLLTRAVEHGYSTGAAHYVLGVTALEKGSSLEAVRELSMVKGKQFPYRGLFLSIALRDLGKRGKSESEYRNFIRNMKIPLLEGRPGPGPSGHGEGSKVEDLVSEILPQ